MARILIVEDDESVREFTARALAAPGRTIDTAEDGEEGLHLIAQAGGAYDLVLSDIRMPMMDGIAMAREAASLYPGLKILLMTGFADQRERAGDLMSIIIDVVPTPFALVTMRQAGASALAA